MSCKTQNGSAAQQEQSSLVEQQRRYVLHWGTEEDSAMQQQQHHARMKRLGVGRQSRGCHDSAFKLSGCAAVVAFQDVENCQQGKQESSIYSQA
jgi:hypothetical protein